ncbi:acyltransferase family protein [Candidatus Planktophila lacus]|uniref:Acyltransferase n=1 Tax=Candidatus Planktophila lacus TaxID=1884913 RepID=A0AAC9YPJ8_9ACTN|nr:acyltransferase [Candidatus Planktophila lacus]ASY10006.1 acyltransferase [Candidatus Planktophila lacus]
MNGPNLKNEKLIEIQFLRVLAIMSVVIFHFTARRASELPYGKWVSGEPWSLGWIGVELFFIVSGFVIAFSISRTSSMRNFLINRAIRLYPALILLLPAVYVVQRFTPHSPYSDRSTLWNLIGSATLIPPTVLNHVSDQSFDWLTLVLWSLKVEVFFYLLCAFMVFLIGKNRLSLALIVFVTMINFLVGLNEYLDDDSIFWVIKSIKVFGFDYLAWFLIGVLIYDLRFKPKSKLLSASLVLVSTSTLINLYFVNDSSIGTSIAGLVVVGVALAFGLFCVIKRFWMEKWILAIGNSSYELYLVHQGVGLTFLIYLVNRYELGAVNGTLSGISIVAVLTYLCHLIFVHITGPFNLSIKRAIPKKWY